MYLLWKRNGPGAAFQGFPSCPKRMLGPEAPGQVSQATPDQVTEKTLTLGSPPALPFRRRTVVSKVESNYIGQTDNLGRPAQRLPPWGASIGQPRAPFPH